MTVRSRAGTAAVIGKSLLVVAGIGIYAGQHESEQSTKREHVGTRVGFGEAILLGRGETISAKRRGVPRAIA